MEQLYSFCITFSNSLSIHSFCLHISPTVITNVQFVLFLTAVLLFIQATFCTLTLRHLLIKIEWHLSLYVLYLKQFHKVACKMSGYFYMESMKLKHDSHQKSCIHLQQKFSELYDIIVLNVITFLKDFGKPMLLQTPVSSISLQSSKSKIRSDAYIIKMYGSRGFL